VPLSAQTYNFSYGPITHGDDGFDYGNDNDGTIGGFSEPPSPLPLEDANATARVMSIALLGSGTAPSVKFSGDGARPVFTHCKRGTKHLSPPCAHDVRGCRWI